MLVLRTASRLVHPILFLFSIFLLINGHDQPGGGFSGGLVAAAAFVLMELSGVRRARRLGGAIAPAMLLAAGLGVAALSGIVPMLAGRAFLTGLWAELHTSFVGKISVGTPTLFDVGVYLVVLGVTVGVVGALEES